MPVDWTATVPLKNTTLGEALRLWRDDALAGLACPALDSARVGLDELHLVTWEQYVGVALDLGRHEEVLSDVAALVEAHPLRERLVTAYMLALYRVGRAHDALRAFHRLRQRLGDELGRSLRRGRRPCSTSWRGGRMLRHRRARRGGRPRRSIQWRGERPRRSPRRRGRGRPRRPSR